MSDTRLSAELMEEGQPLQRASLNTETNQHAITIKTCSIEDDRDMHLADSIGKKLRETSPSPKSRIIFRVPKTLRTYNEKAYQPFVVSIGPYHHGKENLHFMEQVKSWYLHSLLSRVSYQGIKMTNLVKCVCELEKRARECYDEPVGLKCDDFLEMLILDGCFIIEVFRKNEDDSIRNEHDPIFNMASMATYIGHDLFLLENQMPWFVLQSLFELTIDRSKRNFSLTELAFNFFQFHESIISNPKPNFECEILHILDMIHYMMIAPVKDEKPGDDKTMLPCVRELMKAGVEFEKGEKGNVLKLEFQKGKLLIPPVKIDEMTEPLLRNLIAFEQQYHKNIEFITSYAIFMDRLIDSQKDLENLHRKEIINMWLSTDDIVKFFDKLYNDAQIYKFYYSKLCKDVDNYRKENWHKWKALLKNEYFDNPWATLSCFAAIVIVALEVLQAFCSVKDTWNV